MPVKTWQRWDLRGLRVTEIRFDFRFTMRMWAKNRSLELIFETPFIYRARNGIEQQLDPEEPSSLTPLSNLVNADVLEFRASSWGECLLQLGGGIQLEGYPHQDFEAWQSIGTQELEGASLLCVPGGGRPW